MEIDDRADAEALHQLITQQYWRDDFNLSPEDTTPISLLQKPCQTNESVNQLFYSEIGRRQLKSVPESSIIREVTSLLKGYRGVLFQLKDDHFQVKKKNICIYNTY